ncbi:GlgB N-terminal domain-containing protein [Paeniglutamicibacter cryotolerans]|uniref:1,4-alpha-glucan branching enzyme n=1 Tax=Paeniglutamicibacter cryotolerans TaxID=670079 RepID=A0A839QGR8_9MICC|nr:hypothetical protein [Paeniglutamicibacter cryotolerans]MBB2995369.1 1,4-alpha-glucan branching enzyme [Paeniglutamicibacter cryotolerans]
MTNDENSAAMPASAGPKAVNAGPARKAIARGAAKPLASVKPRRASAIGVPAAGALTPAASSAGPPLSVTPELLERISRAEYHAPHAVLGAHLEDEGEATVRVLRPLAHAVTVLTGAGRTVMEHEYGGVWVAVVPVAHTGHVPDYRIETTYLDGAPRILDDPYRHPPTLGELELHLIATGKHANPGEVLGSRVRHYHSELGDSDGTSFALWEPRAQAIRVIGSFNHWDGTHHAMRALGRTGVWELFIPGVGVGAVYKYQIHETDGTWRETLDPMAPAVTDSPATGSVVE